MTGRKLKNWLKAYLKYTAYSEAPEIFHFWTGVSTIAGALRRRVWIDQRYFLWTPNFYIILVAPAGIATKSTTIGIGVDLLRNIEGIHFGPTSMTWQAMTKALARSQEEFPIGGDMLTATMHKQAAITCAISELGTFLDPGDRKLVDVFTDLWEGQTRIWEHETATQGSTRIENPWVNVIGATTPAWLKANFPEEMIGGGLASRIIFVFANRKRQLVAYPGLVSENSDHKEQQALLIHDLEVISQMAGEYTMSAEAILWGEEWYRNHWSSRPVHMASDRFEGYIARKQTHVHKLAIVLAAAKSNALIVDKDSLEAANKIVTATEHDMLAVFESIGVAPTARSLTALIAFLATHKDQGVAVTEQAMLRHAMHVMSLREYEEALQVGVKAGYIRIAPGNPTHFHLKADPAAIRRELQASRNDEPGGAL